MLSIHTEVPYLTLRRLSTDASAPTPQHRRACFYLLSFYLLSITLLSFYLLIYAPDSHSRRS